ncbi:unnamed protein product [Candida verbasci]|uniref:Uncharacterized protein n=1 Tax=Candida verbasci TaxID=1227364 RepID=A0A9W4XLE6_9ASCO|nr:unnamed protein product [Candida verbasci]
MSIYSELSDPFTIIAPLSSREALVGSLNSFSSGISCLSDIHVKQLSKYQNIMQTIKTKLSKFIRYKPKFSKKKKNTYADAHLLMMF